MRYIGVIRSGTPDDPDMTLTSVPVERLMPTKDQVVYLSGEIRNKGDQKIIATLYTQNREVQGISIYPNQSLKVKNVSCSRLILRALQQTTVCEYFFVVIDTDTDEEDPALLVYSDIQKEDDSQTVTAEKKNIIFAPQAFRPIAGLTWYEMYEYDDILNDRPDSMWKLDVEIPETPPVFTRLARGQIECDIPSTSPNNRSISLYTWDYVTPRFPNDKELFDVTTIKTKQKIFVQDDNRDLFVGFTKIGSGFDNTDFLGILFRTNGNIVSIYRQNGITTREEMLATHDNQLYDIEVEINIETGQVDVKLTNVTDGIEYEDSFVAIANNLLGFGYGLSTVGTNASQIYLTDCILEWN